MDMGLLPPSFPVLLRQQAKPDAAPCESEPHEFDAYCNNARVIKAALCAGKLCMSKKQLDMLKTSCILLCLNEYVRLMQSNFCWPLLCTSMGACILASLLLMCYVVCCAGLCWAVLRYVTYFIVPCGSAKLLCASLLLVPYSAVLRSKYRSF